MGVYRFDELIEQTRRVAAEYRRETGKTLAVSGELAVADAVNYLNLSPAPDDALGFDAVDQQGRRVLIKGRVVFDERKGGHRLGQLKLEREWDLLAMVLLDENYRTTEIFACERAAIEAHLDAQQPNKRGSLTIARLKIIGERVWCEEA
ncbi:MAG: hypothetical protein AAF384_16785 [Pseudomonadota bacterium]